MSVRLSEEEYDRLRLVSTSHGARSMSEFVRSSLIWIIANCDRELWDFLVSSGIGSASGSRAELREKPAAAVSSTYFAEPGYLLRSDRRLRRRYTIEMDITARIPGSSGRLISGKTVNLSSRGMLFVAAEPISVGSRVELVLDWPIRSIAAEPLRLETAGRVVRCNENLVAVRLQGRGLPIFRGREQSMLHANKGGVQ